MFQIFTSKEKFCLILEEKKCALKNKRINKALKHSLAQFTTLRAW